VEDLGGLGKNSFGGGGGCWGLQRTFKQQQVSRLWQQLDPYFVLNQDDAASNAKASALSLFSEFQLLATTEI